MSDTASFTAIRARGFLAVASADGSFTAARIAVGKDGMMPPM
jgi:hypothetical protein